MSRAGGDNEGLARAGNFESSKAAGMKPVFCSPFEPVPGHGNVFLSKAEGFKAAGGIRFS